MNKLDVYECKFPPACPNSERLIKFVSTLLADPELLAELSKDVEPVAIAECHEVHGSMCQFINRTRYGMDNIKDGDKLYLRPSILAELSNDAEPVAEVAPSTDGSGVIGVKWCSSSNDVRRLMYGDKLYLHQANTAEIEQRVAEACAELVITDAGTCDSHVIATQIICGKWREYL